MKKLMTFALAAFLTTSAMGLSTSSAQAGGCYDCYYKTITVYETVYKPYCYYVTKYDHCGTPYKVKKTGYKAVQVPVKKRVKVCY